MKRCITCGSKNVGPETSRLELIVAGITFKATSPALVCSDCGEDYVSADDLGRFETSVARWLAHNGICTPESFRFMRKSIGIAAKRLAELLGVTAETVSRWERADGGLPVDERAFAILGGLVADKHEGRQESLSILHALRQPAEIPSKPVHLKLKEAS